MKKDVLERFSPYIDSPIDKSEAWDREKTHEERTIRQNHLAEIGKLKQEIIDIRRDETEYGLKDIELKIEALSLQKKDVLSGSITKAEILNRVKKTVARHRDRAIERFLIEPITGAKSHNQIPFDQDLTLIAEFPSRHVWDIFFLSIHNEDLERVVSNLPDDGLSLKERKAEVGRINGEIEKLTVYLQEQMAEAIKEREERAMKKAQLGG